MFKQVKAALDSLKFTDKYFQGFLDNDLDDDAVRCCLDSADFQPILKEVMSSTGHRIKFLKSFRAVVERASRASNVTIKQETPCGSGFHWEQENTMKELKLLTPEETPTQVQIMDFQPDANGGLPKIVFFEDSYQRIVEKSGNRRIAVVAIAGPSNKGKSVFLNFVLRYLQAKKEGTVDWMGWREPPQPLKGFSWGNGDVVTKGIWMWSEPIPYQTNGQDVDVYLMDTQGVYDESLGHREWSILVGLSMLTSSCFIFNIAQDLQEDCLQFFKSFLSFGLYALEQDGSDENLKPFQKLVFLIRDWEKFNEYPYGGKGGQEYIEKKLECKETHSEDLKRVRQQMKACFEDISCYLFPNPGEEARDVSFKGAVNATTKFREFVGKIQGCIESLMSEANLPVKKLQGNVLTGGDLLALFKSYTTLLNAEEAPSPESFYIASIQSCNATVVGQCTDAFTAEIESALSEHGCMDDVDLEMKLMAAKKTTLMLFDKLRKMGDSKNINEARSTLTARIMEKSELFGSKNKHQNSEIKSKVDEELKRITETFNAAMESKLFGNIVTSESLQAFHSEAFSQAKSALQDALKSFKLRPTVADAALKTLEVSADLKTWEKKMKEINKSIEADMAKLMAIAQSKYREGMSLEQFTSVDDFWNAHVILRSSCLAELKTSTKLLSKTGLAVYEEKLSTKLEEISDIYLQHLNKMMDDLKDKKELCHGNCIQVYSSSMDKMLKPSGQNPVNKERLGTYHQESVSVAVKDLKKFFDSTCNQRKDAETSFTDAESRLVKDLCKNYKEYQQRNKNKLDNFEASARNYVGEAKEKYREKVREAIEQIFDEAEYTAEADNIKDTLIQDIMQKIDTNLARPDFLTDLRRDFSSYTVNAFADYLEMFRLRQEEDQIAVQAALLDARKLYREQMDKKFKARKWFQPENLHSLSTKLCNDILRKCKEDVELSDRQQNQLQQSLKSIFLEYEEKNFKLIPSGSYAIGIDLGTTYSCVGVYINGKVQILSERESKTVPSYVAFNDDRTILVGESAKDLSFRHPEHTIFDAKRLIGRKFDDPVVQEDIKLWPFIVTHENNQPRLKCRGKSYRPEEISARVLSKLKQMAQDYLGKPVSDAVVTVPAYFNDAQRQATKDAAKIAGLNATILTEPVAAAIAYGIHHTDGLKKNVLVFDLGGGTFDVAVLEIKGGEIRTRSINGDTHLGGEDFDNDILKHLIETTRTKFRVDFEDGKSSSDAGLRREANSRLRRLRAECEKRKRDLSFETVAEIFQDLSGVGMNLKERLTRSVFEKMIAGKLNDCMKIVDKALTDARLKKSDIDDIVLVGGSTKIPKVRKMLAEYFDGREVSYTVNPDEAVAVGAAIRAAVLNGKQATGLRVYVADVAPMSIGIENASGRFVAQIARNTPLPASFCQQWGTFHPNQTAGTFQIFEGEEEVAAANNFLGRFDLTGIPPAPPGVEPLDVRTVIDDEGIVTIEATCRSSKSRNQIKILTYKGRMSKNEIDACRKTDLMRW